MINFDPRWGFMQVRLRNSFRKVVRVYFHRENMHSPSKSRVAVRITRYVSDVASIARTRDYACDQRRGVVAREFLADTVSPKIIPHSF